MSNVLVVEDEPPIANLLRLSLAQAGHSCVWAADGIEAADLAEDGAFDLALVDVMIPGIDGFELMGFLAALGVPVIFLTAMGTLDKRVKGLRMGAEDYIVKPFEIDELLARVDVVLRRTGKSGERLMVDGVAIDTKAMRVTRDDREIALTRKEYDLLAFLARNPNVALYRDTIYERVWGGDMAAGSKTVDLHVQRLRRKTGLSCIQAVSKVGYRLTVDPRSGG